MPKMGDLAAQDGYGDLELAPYGVGSSAETAKAPSGMGSLASSAYQYLGDLAKRAFGASEQMRMGGVLNPAPMVEAAMLPMTGAVAGTGPGGFAVGAGPIKAYHASPHDFDKFDLAKIGSGEGAQVYGHGLYFAESPAVSGRGGQYWQQFQSRFDKPEQTAAAYLKDSDFDRGKAIEALNRTIDKGGHPTITAHAVEALKVLESGKPVGPRTYEVNIKADPAHMLDWDKPLKEQGRIGEAFQDVVPKPGWLSRQLDDIKTIRHGLATDPESPGSKAYGMLARMLDQPRASEALREAGIPGIKYLDEGSRISSPGQIDLIRQNIAQREALLAKNPGNPTDTKWLAEYQDMLKRAENPTSNYVVFDPSIIDIMKKYGIAGAAPAGMGALAAQDTYRRD